MYNGGPAFPMQFLGIDRGQLSYEDTDNQEGMSLRDWFAGMTLTAIISEGGWTKDPHDNAEKVARQAYLTADAMLEERQKQCPATKSRP